MGIQGDPNSARRLGVEGREDSTSTRSLLLRRGMRGPRPWTETGRRLVLGRCGGCLQFMCGRLGIEGRRDTTAARSY